MQPVVLLDFWGVIGVVQSDADLAEMANLIGAGADEFTAAYWRHRAPYDAGGRAADYWNDVAADVGVSVSPSVLSELIELDTRSWSGVHADMITFIEELAASGARLALLSNAPSDLVPHASQVLDGLVLQLLFSSELGYAKPAPEIYAEALAALDVSAAEVVFIDDNPENVAAARECGMQAIHHTSVESTRHQLRLLTG